MSNEAAIIDNALHNIVIANRILARENVIDDYGHVSIRHPLNPSRFFISRSRSPELVTLHDIMEFELDGTPIDQRGRVMYSERILHGAIYMARPDVNAVTHHHARAVLPFANTEIPLRPIFHMGSVIGPEVPVWDSQDEFGDTNMLIDDLAKGQSLARKLGKARCVLMRGHGAVCVGDDIKAAVFVSIYMKENAELVLQTMPLEKPTYLTPGEIEQTADTLLKPHILARSWEYRIARAGFGGL